MSDIQVSIVCNTYNQEKYIRDALDSFLMQKTNFAFEILVHDDASTDKTADIIREYAEKYPDLIKPYIQTENQYSKGVKISNKFQFPRAKGKYIAMCEGDDYWTDPYKLQKQFDIMEAHPELDICAHKVMRVKADTKEFVDYISPSEVDRIFTVEEVIDGEGGFVGTNSLFFRVGLDKEEYEFRKKLSIDYSLQILGALRGGMYYIAENMSSYRYMADGSWSKNIECLENDFYEKWYLLIIDMLKQLDKDTDFKYTDVINKRIKIKTKSLNYYRFVRLEYRGKCKELLSDELSEIFNELPLKRRLSIRIKAYFPWLVNLVRRIRKIGKNGK